MCLTFVNVIGNSVIGHYFKKTTTTTTTTTKKTENRFLSDFIKMSEILGLKIF